MVKRSHAEDSMKPEAQWGGSFRGDIQGHIRHKLGYIGSILRIFEHVKTWDFSRGPGLSGVGSCPCGLWGNSRPSEAAH